MVIFKMRGEMVIRQWKILQFINSRPGITISEMEQELKVSSRTIRRDIEALEEAGFPLYNERVNNGIGWFFVEGYKLPQIQLSTTELMSLYIARRLFSILSETDIGVSLKALISRVESTLSPQTRSFLKSVEETFFCKPWAVYQNNYQPALLKDIQRAIQERKKITIDYYSISRDMVETRDIDPLKILYVKGNFYLVAYCHKRKAMRTFNIQRIKAMHICPEHFTFPENFSIEEYIESSFGVFKGEKEQVKILFSPDVSRWIKEKEWHPSQKIEEREDGSLVLSMEVEGFEEISSWVLSFGEKAVILEPEELRNTLVKRIEKMRKNYSK